MTLQFDNAWVLYFLWIVPAIAVWWMAFHRRNTRAMAAFVAPSLQRRLFPSNQSRRITLQIALATTGMLLVLVAWARPRWGEREETVYQQARDLVIALDVSRSMLANDVHPTRLRRAKIDLIDLIDALRGDRAALVAFRAKAALVCPLTTDYAFLRQALDGVSPESVPRGETDIGGAIEKALEAFDEEDASHKAIVLISDGEDLSGRAIEAATKAGERHIPIYTVGLGSRQGSRIPDDSHRHRYQQHDDKDVVTKLHHDTLYEIAKSSGGSYIPVETASMTSTTLGTIYRDHLRKINARELAETREMRAIERYQWFLLPGIIFMLAACFLSRGRLGASRTVTSPNAPEQNTLKDLSLPERELKQVSVALLLALASQFLSAAPPTPQGTGQVPSPLAAPATPTAPPTNAVAETSQNIDEALADLPSGRNGARVAQKLFKQGKYRAAAEAYTQSAAGVSRSAARAFRHNAAVALAEAGDYEEAATMLRELSLQTRRGERDENAALGTALFLAAEKLSPENPDEASERVRLFREAGEAFKEAWRTDPQAANAKHDVAVAISRLSEESEQASILELAKKYEQTPAPQLANKILTEQREIARLIPAAITNRTPARIGQLEQLAARQKEAAKLWLPLKGKLTEAMAQQNSASNTQQMAAFNQLLDVTREEMQDAAYRLRDLEADGFRAAKLAEHGSYQLWKAVAPYGMLLQEDIRQQTNVQAQVAGKTPEDEYNPPKDIQNEAALLTQMFKERFAQAVPEAGTMQQEQPTAATASPTNAPAQPEGISAETRAKILELADEAISAQTTAADLIGKNAVDEAIAQQSISTNRLAAIQELLPKQQNQQQQQQKKNQQNQQDQQDKQQDQQEQQQDQQDQQEPQEQQEQQPADEKDEQQPQDREQQDVRELLQRALQREREHEAEKKKRQNLIPLPAFERDW